MYHLLHTLSRCSPLSNPGKFNWLTMRISLPLVLWWVRMYTSTKAPQKPSFLPMDTSGNHRFNIPGGAVGFNSVPQAAAVTLILPFHFLTGTHGAAKRLVEQWGSGDTLRLRYCTSHCCYPMAHKALFPLTLVPSEHHRAADLSIPKQLDYETALTMMFN